ncbi:MAG: LysR family transcriptional regulator [Zoogloea sp.]|nr:LysR family transcriptional regulator [Zoogloea sp.]
MLSPRQIRYLLAIADTGSLTAAATRLFVAQPALSRQLSQAEEALGFALFVREPRGVAPTPAGALFLDRVRGVAALLDEAVDEARRLERGEVGVLRLLHSSSVPVAGPVLETLQAFAAALPGVRVDLDRVSSEQQGEEIVSGRADMGLVRLPVLKRSQALIERLLPAESLWAAIPAGHPLAGEAGAMALVELRDACFVSAVHRERGGLARRVTDLCLEAGFVPALAAVQSRKTSMLTLVAAGFGVAVIPACMCGMAPPGVILRPIADPAATSIASIILPEAASPLALRFAALLEARWAARV